jgi:hypothetical protein
MLCRLLYFVTDKEGLFLRYFSEKAGATEDKLAGRSRQVGVELMLQTNIRDLCLNTRCID